MSFCIFFYFIFENYSRSFHISQIAKANEIINLKKLFLNLNQLLLTSISNAISFCLLTKVKHISHKADEIKLVTKNFQAIYKHLQVYSI